MGVNARKLERLRDNAGRVVGILTDARLREIERRAKESAQPDGYGRGGDSVRSSDVADPTGTCVVELAEHHHVTDPQMVAFGIIERELGAMAKSADRISKAWSVVQYVGDGRRGRETTLGACNACLRAVANSANDRIVNGYCPACRMAWVRAGRPDRVAFENARRAALVDNVDTGT